MWTPGGQIDHRLNGCAFGGGGKGGSSAPTVKPTYTDPVNGQSFDNPQLLNDEIVQRQAGEKTASAAATDTSNALAAQNESTFQGKLSDAILQGRNNINQYFTNNGIDPNQYGSQIDNAINTSKNSIADLDPNPMAAFPGTLGASIVNDITAGKQAQNQGALSKIFTPTYSQDALQLSAIDPSITSVLNSQFDPLASQLQNAQKRGTLNDRGYQAALDSLGNKKTAATSTLNSLGSGIINNDRSALDSYISTAKNAANNVNLSDPTPFDPTKYTNEASSMVSRNLNNLTGDLTNAVGSTTFADLPSLLNAGGSVQGANDPTATNPNGAVGPGGQAIGGGGVSPSFIADQVLANTKRGLGSQGAY